MISGDERGDRSTRAKGEDGEVARGMEFRVIGFEYNQGVYGRGFERIRNASTILRGVVVIRVH